MNIKDISMKSPKDWTDEEKQLMYRHWRRTYNPIGAGSGVGGTYYPNLFGNDEFEELTEGFEETFCDHDWQEKPLFTSTFEECSKCGEIKK